MARAVIFDLDGTLADSEPAHERALVAAAEAGGLRITPEGFRARCVGLGEAACFRMLAREQGVAIDDAVLAGLIAAKLERFVGEVAGRGLAAYPGAVALVEACAGAAPVAVCSGSSRGSVEPMLRAIGLDGRFGAVVTSCDVARPKPDPEGYLLAASRIGHDPGECVAVEDSPTGVAAALAAGLRVVAVEHSYPASRLDGAHRVVNAVGELRVEMLLGM